MGWNPFASKIKTYVGTSVSRVSDANAYTRSSELGLARSLARNEDLMEHVLNELVKGAGFKAINYFELAKQGYINGLPSDTTVTQSGLNGPITAAVTTYITGLEGTAIDPDYVIFGPPNFFHLGWKHIYEDLGYEPSTDELAVVSVIKGYPVTLTAVNLLVSTGIVNSYDLSCFYSLGFPGSLVYETGRTTVGLQVEYEWVVPPVAPATASTLMTETMIVSNDIDLDGLSSNADYYSSKYTVLATGEDKFFDYRLGSGVASLDALLNFEYSAPGTYFPFVHFRTNYAKIDDESTEYTESVNLCKQLGFSYQDIVDALHDLTDRTQEDLDKVVSSFLYFAVPADGTTQVEQQYLYRFFEKHFNESGGVTTSLSLVDFNNTLTATNLRNSAIVIKDQKQQINLSNRGIFKRVVNGVIGDVNTYAVLKDTVSITEIVGVDESITTNTYTFTYHLYRKQTSATQYTEYQVIDLVVSYRVEGNYYATSGFTEDVEDEKDILLIPLDRELLDDLGSYEREELCYRALHIVNNSLVRIKVKWYQRGGWTTFFKIAAIAALVFGFVEGFKMLYALIVVGNVSLVYAIELALGQLYLMLQDLLYAKLFITVAGDELAQIAAIILMIYGLSGGNISTAYFDLKVTDLLEYSTAIFKQLESNVAKQYESLSLEIQNFSDEMKVKWDELAKLNEELKEPTQIAKIFIGEEPYSFYNRTINTSNIGTKIMDIQQNYVDLSLQLPRNTYNFED